MCSYAWFQVNFSFKYYTKKLFQYYINSCLMLKRQILNYTLQSSFSWVLILNKKKCELDSKCEFKKYNLWGRW